MNGIEFTYYGRGDGIDQGKIKSIGKVKLTYHGKADGQLLLGKAKKIGQIQVSYGRKSSGVSESKVVSIKGTDPDAIVVLAVSAP